MARPRRRLGRESLTAFLFVLPSLIGFITFFAVPAVRGLWISFTNWDLLRPAQFIGLGNYARLLQDGEFWNALTVTIYYVLLNIPLQTVLAMVIAVMMHRLTDSVVIKGLLILPWLMPPVVVGLIWLWILDPNLGILNVALKSLGLPAVAFLGLPQWAMPSIAMINIWQYVGYTALLIFAGLQSIPPSVYEAASIDGASESQMFWKVTVPLLRPVLVFVLVTSVIGSFQIFDTIAITTKGGPVNATKVLNWYIYEQAFSRFNMGYATTISIVLFLILIVVSLIQMRLLRAGESDL
ncbi:sugar ABC transporter permease [Litorilinea aerophila]|uniref:carbohydrate ABC transporter permease n=1 Tax=Litorilinea aerophila TaxID=1204385 RepID=UPI001B86F7CA|nr:sugar ABC transporter permease [Litorilinea aerophila]MCC9077734.1 sugar ABC transporter permease [Litorilinea aerophila]